MILLVFGGSKCSDAKKNCNQELYEVPHKQTYVDTTISKMWNNVAFCGSRNLPCMQCWQQKYDEYIFFSQTFFTRSSLAHGAKPDTIGAKASGPPETIGRII